MSFRPTKPASISPEGLTNGNGHLHPTRYNPYPHSHDLPTGEDRLFIVTAEHQFYEINILAGKISDWSRRNPTSALPKEFRSIRDRAMGCIWDVAPSSSPNPDRQRMWLYGNTWLWMFDLAQDLPRPDHDENEESDGDGPRVGEFSQTRKRRREKAARKKSINLSMDHDGDSRARLGKKERDTGAGSRIPPQELVTGVGRKMRKTIGAMGADASFVKLGGDVSDESEAEDDEEEEDEDDLALMKLRRGGDAAMVDGDRNGTDEPDEKPPGELRVGPPFWGTFKYRPILGIVPIGGRGDDEDDDSREGTDGERRGRRRAVEVALVERPMFDVDLPERFYGDQEWSEKKDADVRL
ncbi:MAG: hypothetical protein L6R36_009082 [Xanthoria steineri]|nr:MAG: hypothetical protein L6R36_009082 [Xanthoria steineri]